MSSSLGEKIRNAWKVSGLSQREFAEKLNMSLRNAQNLFDREDFSMQQLISISKVLNTDFIKIYLDDYKEDHDYPEQDIIDSGSGMKEVFEEYIKSNKKRSQEINIHINIRGDINNITKNFPQLLSKIKKEAEDRGLQLV